MQVKVWDRPIRLFHWLLAISVTGALISGHTKAWLGLHIVFGELALCLVLFRIGWGFLGSYYARFESFIKGPKAFFAYFSALARLKPPKVLEHNPVATWVFVSMMLLVFLGGISGLSLLGGQERIGILADYISQAEGAVLADVHEVVVNGLLLLICLHLTGATVDSILHKEMLISALWHGKKEAPDDYQPPKERGRKKGATTFFAISVVASAVFMIWWPTDFRTEETLRALAQEETESDRFYKEECGACHFAFPGNLLPKRSWDKMMAGLEDHFGEDASLEPEDIEKVFQHLGAGAEGSKTEIAYYIRTGIPKGETPLEISKLPYWKKQHEDIEESVYRAKNIGSKTNCGACHTYAFYGSFEDAHVGIPDEVVAVEKKYLNGSVDP